MRKILVLNDKSAFDFELPERHKVRPRNWQEKFDACRGYSLREVPYPYR